MIHFEDLAYSEAKVQMLDVDGTGFAYRAIKKASAEGKTPLVLLAHLGATLDSWDPKLIDLLAKERPIVAVDYEGFGGSEGLAPTRVKDMAAGVARFLVAAKLGTVDVLGLSLGGFVAQQLAKDFPAMVCSLILAGTGPRGGKEVRKVPAITFKAMANAAIFKKDTRHYLFFPERAWDTADEFFLRASKAKHPDRKPQVIGSMRQLVAVWRWGNDNPMNLGNVEQPTLVVNGDHDLMVPSKYSQDMAQRIPNAKMEELYQGAGHGAIFQEPERFAKQVLAFLNEVDAK